jgi:DNA-binding LacI/PurR family transcriptional regulator
VAAADKAAARHGGDTVIDMARDTNGLPTLGAIARVAGVSISTVSKVLNGRPDVAPDTRRRVADLLDQAGYRTAGGQDTRRRAQGTLIEVVANRLDEIPTSKLLRAVCLEASARGAGVIVTDVEPDDRRSGGYRCPPRRWLDAMSLRGAEAVISLLLDFSDGQWEYFEAHAIAACTIGTLETRQLEVRGCAVQVDERAFGAAAARHLLGLGHTRVAVVAGPVRVAADTRLVQGFREAMLARGLRTPDEYVLRISPAEGDIHSATLGLLALRTPPTAIVFANGRTALVGRNALTSAGLRVPRDVSLICCDGLPGLSSSTPYPPLTTLVQPLGEMARAAIDLALTGQRDVRVVDVPPHLLSHGSTAAPPLFGPLGQ